MKKLLNRAKGLEEELIKLRRALHTCAEVGFELGKTKKVLQKELQKLGIEAQSCGKSLALEIGAGERVFLLRADMDGLPIKEKTGLSFACTQGNMHACGHDMHTAMLFGAVKLLKEREKQLKGRVRILFQSAEEVLEGAKDALSHGVADGVSGAMMVHVLTNISLPTGTVVVASGGSAPSADYFTIAVKGKGCHGSAPWNGIDALNAAAYTAVGLNTLSAREISLENPAVLTLGSFQAGTAGNVIADRAELCGTLRSFDESTRARVKKRIEEIAKHTAEAFGAKAKVKYGGGCPTLINDEGMETLALQVLTEGLGEKQVFSSKTLQGDTKAKSGGSEDFAYISRELPSVMLAIAAGEPERGYEYPLHHSKARFDEGALAVGSFAYAAIATAFLEK